MGTTSYGVLRNQKIHLVRGPSNEFISEKIRFSNQEAAWLEIVNVFTTMLEIFELPLLLSLISAAMANYEDETGISPMLLRGTPEAESSKTQVSFQQVWANPGKSALKPRKQDLHEPNLMMLMGSDYDHRWMRTNKDKSTASVLLDDVDRKTVRALRALVSNSSLDNADEHLQLPNELPSQYRELVKTWLVRRATCPIRFVWSDLGPYFWPRFIKKGECLKIKTCSWPPGMICVPGTAKVLQILRWHCRRNRRRKGSKKARKKDNQDNNLTSVENVENKRKNGRRKKRKEYECFWIKVPYPVPEDCICSCKSWQ